MSDVELVLGVPRDRLMANGSWRGILHGNLAPYLDLIDREGTFRPRADVETDPAWKQVIPYLVLRDRGRLLLMRRTRAGGDARLHERFSIGVGGHVNPGDGGVAGGLAREWREEIDAEFMPAFRPIGLLNDDTDPVGEVHVGLVFVAEAQGRPAAIREVDKLEGAFVAPADVLRVYDRLETWSALVFDFISARASGTRTPAAPHPA